jgi:hypothetical protein
MEFVTTINPNSRYERQRDCVNSWIKLGATVSSLQLPSEIQKVYELFPDVNVLVASPRKGVWSKETPSINSLIKHYKDKEVLLVNSDIKLAYQNQKEFESYFNHQEQNVLTCGIRYGIAQNGRHTFNPYGIDVFRFFPGMLRALPETDFCLGVPGWDYWIPFYLCTALKFKLRTYFHTQIEHLEHEDRWNDTDQSTAHRIIEKECNWHRTKVTKWIQNQTGRRSWTHRFSYGLTQRILDGSRTVYKA